MAVPAAAVDLREDRRQEMRMDGMGPRRRIGIIGAGPGGICAGIELLLAGYRDVVVWERAPRIGGTWHHNTYPGCACDIPAHLYSFSFERKVDWTRPYAPQHEIQAYLQHCVDAYGIGPYLR